MKKILLSVLFLTVVLALAAHEFWLDPGKYFYQKGETVNLRFMVGENFIGENWTGNKSKVHRLDLYSANGSQSLTGRISASVGDSLRFPLENEGTQLICFNSTNSFISLPPKEFNEYLEEDHLADAIRYRNNHGETDSTGREFYQRSVKTIIQVGNVFTNTFSLETSLPLDIIPLQNPYRLDPDDSLSIRVLFRGKPLSNQVMLVWHRNKEIFLKVSYRTNQQGEIRFPVMSTSTWMVSTVRMERIKKGDRADWQSYWGSLTWGYH
ncbi:MAG: DUF4198 domain-containing protein [Chitinophagaceae bacterium]